MPLGYKYVERDATDFVNWAEIGKNMSDMLANENKIREEKKAAIDEDSRQLGMTLSEYPQGQDANARTAALKLADDATQYKNMQLKLLKSGKLKLRDYLINTQNLKDDITRSFDALESYQKGYGETMDQYREGKLSIMTVQDWAKLDEIGGDWGGVQFVINPVNGVLNLAKTQKKTIDGKEVMSISDNPNDIYSMNQIMGITKRKIDKLDVQKISDDWSSKMGVYIKTNAAMSAAAGLWKQGKVVTIDDITRRADELKLSNGERQEIFNFYNAENQWIDSSLSNPYARGSVLMDHLQFEPTTQKAYRRTHDKADAAANPEAIYEEINPSTQQPNLVFSDKQKKDSNDFVRNMTRPKYKYEEKTQMSSQLQDPFNAGREEKNKEIKTAENFGQNLTWLLSGNDIESAAGAKYISGETRFPLVKGKDGVEVTDKQGNKQIFKFNEKGQIANPLKLAKSIIGAVNNIDLNEDEVLKAVKKFMPKNARLNQTSEASGFEKAATPADPLTQYGSHVSNLVSTISADDLKDEEKAFDVLNKKLTGLGARVRIPFTAGDYIVVTAPNGVESDEIKLKDDNENLSPDAAKQISDFLKANPKGANPAEQTSWVQGLQKTGVVSSVDTSKY